MRTKNRPYEGKWILWGFTALVFFAACNSSNSAERVQSCSLNSDCAGGLVCAFSRCRARCVTAADCPDGLCVNDGRSAACHSALVACSLPADCDAPLACASDYRCRNLCATDGDCNVLGINGRVCAADKNGVHYCADPKEVVNGQIVVAPPRGAPDAAVIEPIGTTPVLADATITSGQDFDATMSEASSEGSSVQSGPDAQPDVTGAAPVCSPACAQGTTCAVSATSVSCVPCGMNMGDPCCDGKTCGANLTCSAAGMCQCGGANQSCCGGTVCRSGLSCDSSDAGPPVCACGEPGTRCCPGEDGGADTCGAGLACNGAKCSCVAAFASAAQAGSAPGVVLRVDRTVWAANLTETSHAYTEMVDLSGVPLRATAIAASGAGTATPIGCAIVRGGAVWCFPVGDTLTDSTFLGAGLGPADATSSPVQVTAAGGTPLANITQIAGGTSPNGANFCAVGASGGLWCWGFGQDGQLGNGGTSNSNVASAVMANASTAFSGAIAVGVASASTCAARRDGTVWCWGRNYLAALGDSNYPNSPYPLQVPLPVADAGAGSGDAGSNGAVRLATGTIWTHCALMRDTTVVCWGYTVGDRLTGPPTTILTSGGGPPLTGILDLAGNSYGVPGASNGYVCGKNSSLQVLCWVGPPGSYPLAFKDGSGAAAVGVIGPLSASSYGLGYLDPSGRPVTAGVSGGPVPPCTGLLP